jgi:hypothetical protein
MLDWLKSWSRPRPRLPRSYMVLDPWNKPISHGHPDQESAIKAAEERMGHDWRWMIECGFRISWS